MLSKNGKGYKYKPIPNEDGHVESGWRFYEIRDRIGDEQRICRIRCRGGLLLFLIVFTVYFCLGVQRNLAYYRHIPGDPLQDFGFEVLPSIPSEGFREQIEAVYYAILCALAIGCLLGNLVYQPPHLRRVYVMNMLLRVTFAFGVGQFFRGWTFLATSLPGPSPHCNPMSDIEYWSRKPKSILECFSWVNITEPNCGDLMFSGHIFTLITVVHYTNKFSRSLLEWLPLVHKIAAALLYAMVLFECYMILRARNHYTVDVFVALYATPLWLYFVDSVWRFDVDLRKTEDLDLESAAINEV